MYLVLRLMRRVLIRSIYFFWSNIIYPYWTGSRRILFMTCSPLLSPSVFWHFSDTSFMSLLRVSCYLFRTCLFVEVIDCLYSYILTWQLTSTYKLESFDTVFVLLLRLFKYTYSINKFSSQNMLNVQLQMKKELSQNLTKPRLLWSQFRVSSQVIVMYYDLENYKVPGPCYAVQELLVEIIQYLEFPRWKREINNILCRL